MSTRIAPPKLPEQRILVSLFAQEESLLRRRLDWLQHRVGKVELRLDVLPPELNLQKLLASYPTLYWVAACHEQPAGESRQARLLRAADAGFDCVDFPIEDGAPPQLPEGVQRLLSWHQEQADDTDLHSIHQQLCAFAAPKDLLKIVAWADTAEQAWPVLDLYQDAQPGSLLAFAQGPGGSASRVLSLVHAAPWIYSSWPGEATAPGQWNVAQLLDMLPSSLDAGTLSCGVLGNPVLHSLSPFLWQQAMRDASGKCQGLYLPYPVADLPLFLAGARRHGLSAFSVTAPFKQEAFRIAQHSSAAGVVPGSLGQAAEACRAANFLRLTAEGWQSGNSDGVGAITALESAAKSLPAKAKILLLGAGGAAKAVAVDALRRGYQPTIAARKPAVSAELRIPFSNLEQVDLQSFDAVIQATPVGGVSKPGLLCPGRPPRALAIALDMVYHPLRTQWLQQAEDAGAIPIAGTSMLLHQMRAQFQLVFPDLEPPDYDLLQDSLAQYLIQRQALVLVGARAAGKSTLGRTLATHLGWDFFDADDTLEAQSNRSVRDWLANDPSGFRKLESKILIDLVSRPYAVIATGGGVVESASSVTLLKQEPRVVWLQCSPDELCRRQQATPRPPLSNLDLAAEIETLLLQREPAYNRISNLVISTNNQAVDAVRDIVLHFGLQGIPHGFR